MVFKATMEAAVNGFASVPRVLGAIKYVIAVALLLCWSVSARASSMGLVVSGLGGSEKYDQQFYEQGQSIIEALSTLENDADAFKWLSGSDATAQKILSVLSTSAVQNAEVFYLVLLGHGVSNADGWWFNVSGPDLNGNELLTALNQLKASKQFVLLATSASGVLLEPLSQPGRAVITATKSGGEINAVRFPEYVAQAMQSSKADIDRNELLTLAELWRFSNSKTQEYYKREKLLASEHARISSTGLEGLVVSKMGALKAAKNNPEVALLLQQRLLLEEAFLALKAQKPALGVAEFYAQLEPLVLDIAKLQQKIDTATAWVDEGVQ